MRGLTYSNVVATVALFVALGGGAVALEGENSVNSGDIKNGTVKAEDLKNDAVTGSKLEGDAIKTGDVADGELTGADIENSSLTHFDVDIGAFPASSFPVAGLLPAQARSIGGDGDTTFGPVAGRVTASTSMDDVQMAFPTSAILAHLRVFLPDDLDVGEERTFTVVRRSTAAGAIVDTSLSCTIDLFLDECTDDGSTLLAVGGVPAVRIENTGAALDPDDDAFISLTAKGEF